MPNPTVRDLHVPSIRNDISIAAFNDREFLAGDAIAPVLPVDKQTDYYPTWSQADSMRIQADQRSPKAPLPIMEMAVSTTQYNCLNYGGKVLITDVQRASAKNELQLDEAMTRFVQEQCLLKRESLIAAAYWTTGVWGTDSTPSTKWSAASSDPFGDIRTGCRSIQQKCGKWPTDLILGADVWDELSDHTDTIARVSGGARPGDPAVVTKEQIAAVLGLKRVTVAAPYYNTAGPGVAVSLSPLYDTNDALLIYRPDSPGQFEPSGAYTMSWSEFDNVKDGQVALWSYRNEDPKGEFLCGEMYLAPVVTFSGAGYFFNEATS